MFSYESECSSLKLGLSTGLPLNSHSSALVNKERLWLVETEPICEASCEDNFLGLSQPFQFKSSVFRTGFTEAGSTGFNTKKNKPRKRPSKNTRKFKPLIPPLVGEEVELKSGIEVGGKAKRKTVEEGTSSAK